MPKTTTRPSGLVLKQIDARTIEWAYPPMGPRTKGRIARRGDSGDQWSATNLHSLRSGNWSIVAPATTLKRCIERIESHIKQEHREREAENEKRRREQEEREARERQEEDEELGLQEYLDDLFQEE